MQYLKKEMSDEVDFLNADNHESFNKLILWFLMGMVKHSQSFQNSKFAMILQYLKKEVSNEVECDKHQSFPQVEHHC